MNLLFGICFLFFGWMANCEDSVPVKAKDYINQLNDYYAKKNPVSGNELFNGKPLFWKKLDGFEKAEQKLMMTIILDTYNRILSHMQNETEDENVQKSFIEVKKYLNNLKIHYFPEKHKDLKKHVNEVMALKETDPVVQRKALLELMTVYNEASKLKDPPVHTHRRRRQAKGARKQRSQS
ncbi:interferon gamma 1 [Astyanax mexicanus]|uniref:Interferon gamma 1 isoform X1 n=3 Tax=Astyanax mexicanus TaxID=7994 RepID=A0A8T2M8B1_ASTMX|nr:interferon gamma 1 [Astyanax mexicanus]KAG9280319.1 interferon gamma 1 isoform X1 [Astyanax mexicanus]